MYFYNYIHHSVIKPHKHNVNVCLSIYLLFLPKKLMAQSQSPADEVPMSQRCDFHRTRPNTGQTPAGHPWRLLLKTASVAARWIFNFGANGPVTKPGRCPASVELGGFFLCHRALFIGSRARWRERISSGHLQATDRTPAGDRTKSVSKWEVFLPMWQQLPAGSRPDIGRNTAGTRAGNRTPCDRRPDC